MTGLFDIVFSLVVLGFAGLIKLTSALEPYDNYREGSCSTLPYRPVLADIDFVDSLKYLSAGSKYLYHRGAPGLPNYAEMDETTLVNNFCLARNSTSLGPIAYFFGFQQFLFPLYAGRRPGIYVEVNFTAPGIPPTPELDSLREYVSLTDHRTFAVLSNCWTRSDQKSWVLLTLRPTVDLRTRRIVERHLIQQGFDRANFVFLNYDRCQWLNPILKLRKDLQVY